MKKIILFALLLSFSIAYSQTPNQDVNVKAPKSASRVSGDAFIVNLYTDVWQHVPDSITARGINQGISAAGMYNIAMGKGNFSFAFGLGISAHNFYSNGQLGLDSNRSSVFTKLPTHVNGNKVDYQVNKLSITYFDIPVEFRFKTASKFRLAVGFKFGFTLDVHTKYRGADLATGDGSWFIKTKKIANIDNMNYALTARIGYKWAIVNMSYSLSNIFKKDKGPDMAPISIGLTAIPF